MSYLRKINEAKLTLLKAKEKKTVLVSTSKNSLKLAIQSLIITNRKSFPIDV